MNITLTIIVTLLFFPFHQEMFFVLINLFFPTTIVTVRDNKQFTSRLNAKRMQKYNFALEVTD